MSVRGVHVLKALYSAYVSVVAGQVSRLMRRGVSFQDAAGTTAFVLAIASGCNLFALLILLGLRPGIGWTPYVIGIAVFIVLERVHRRAIGRLEGLVDRPTDLTQSDSLRSLVYLFGSFAAYVAVAFAKLGNS